jgi:hypothetical protein
MRNYPLMVFTGKRTPFAEQNRVIFTIDGKQWANLPLYLDEVNHSPTGFEWGYWGSGPSQLAYAILRTHYEIVFNYTPEQAKASALEHYQYFKESVIGRIKSKEWTITTEDIRKWWAKTLLGDPGYIDITSGSPVIR